ncbi:hypothetical protein NDR87_31430 [Nocardia sp. CDC159]|uniref:Phage-related protein n=1 Tax=Nocardia pulmonis TaxID=2951408 RepID=A0A9X2IZZ4_9NOCA|nr:MULTISPECIES: hypothetical protein [Nocardia]MCM6777938.1 hypothetical protein [Nocardia pulmonis]MCM6790891.1 hypothetical protein [Nocardia sp. CDC159]
MTAPGGIRIPITADGRGFPEDLTRVVIQAMRRVQVRLDASPLEVSASVNLDTAGSEAQLRQLRDRLQAEARPITQRVVVDVDRAGVAAAQSATARVVAGEQSMQRAHRDTAAAARAVMAERARAAAQLDRVSEQMRRSADAEKNAQFALAQAKLAAASAVPDPEAQALKQERAALRVARAESALAAAKKAAAAVDDDPDAKAEARERAAQRVAAAELSVAAAKRAAAAAAPDEDAAALRRERAALRVEQAENRVAEARRRGIDLARQAETLAQRARGIGIVAPTVSGGADVDRLRGRADAASASFTRLGSAIGTATRTAAGLSAVTAAVAAIGGAAGLAGGAVGGLVVGLSAIGPAAGAIAATAAVGLAGLKDAFKAVSDAAEAAPAEAVAKTKAVAAAQEQLASAAESAESAQRAVAAAQKDATRAAKDVGEAYRQAGRDIEDAALRARGATLSQKEAALDLREAQKEERESRLNPAEHEQAMLRLERAQLSYDRAVRESTRANEDNAETQAKGLEGADAVVAAKERQQAAEERVTQAQQAAAKAGEQVAKAAAAVAEAQNAAAPASEKAAAAMAKLAPNAREFVTAVRGIKPAFEDAARAVQNTGFAGLGATLADVSGRAIPVVRDGMIEVAREINGATTQFTNFIGTARGLEGLRSTFAGSANFLAGLRSGTGEATQGLLDFVAVSEPALEGMGSALSGIGGAIGRVFSEAAASGQLQSVFGGFTQLLESTGPLLGGLISSLLTMADRVLPSLSPLFESLGAALVDIAPELGDLGAVFAQSLSAIMPDLSRFIGALAEGLRPVLPVIAELIRSLLTAVEPLIGPISQVAQVVGTALADALRALAPSMGPIGQAFADLITAAAPLVPLIAENLSVALQALAPALSEIARALAPVIRSFADQMRPVIAQIAPILAEVARTVGLALADALRQIAPMLPELVGSFSQLLLAVLPLLPEFARLAAEILPPLINVLVQMTPHFLRIIDVLTWLIREVIIPLVLPYFQSMADQIASNLEFVGNVFETWNAIVDRVLNAVKSAWGSLSDAVTAVKDWFTDTVFPALGSALERVKGWFTTGVDAITSTWDRLREAAAAPVRFVVNTVWNQGLLKAWNTVAKFLPGVGELAPVQLGFATGGSVSGPGSGTSDDILAWLSNGEHVVTAAEVIKAGGQNVLYAIRDMIARGIPFQWDGGRVVSLLGRDNLDAYGAAVKTRGIGNVPPEGLFGPLSPRFAEGGAVLPWMYQLLRGHEFARAQHGRPYQWAGPRFAGDSFDCSGFMGSIAAVILGLNPWQRYWATASFAGYPPVGPQGFVKSALDGGMVIGVTDDPGGPGGGHTAGVLGALPELGIPSPMRVESGGALGDVHYGSGTDPRSFAAMYGLPIGANGFFQPGAGGGGGGSVGPAPADQRGFVERQIAKVFDAVVGPLRRRIESEIGPPPPEFRKIPGDFLTTVQDGSVHYLSGLVGGLGDRLPRAWTAARELAGRALDAVNPFDSGGIARGTGLLAKDVIDPERVLSPEQTRLFEALVISLQQIAGGSRVSGENFDLLTNTVFSAGIDALAQAFGIELERRKTTPTPEEAAQREQTQAAIDETGRLAAETRELVQRTESNHELVIKEQTEQLRQLLNGIADKLTDAALRPIVQSAVDAAIGVVEDWLRAAASVIREGTDRTTAAVQNLDIRADPGTGAPAPFGAPGSAFDAAKAISDAVVSVANTAQQVFQQVAQQVANAALAQKPSRVDQSKGVLGRDISGGPLVDMIVRLTGVEIEILDTLIDTLEEVRKFRGDQVQAFDSTGRIISDTAELIQRNESSLQLVVNEMNRLNRELIKAVLRYLVLNVLLPIITAILGAMIQLAAVAIGAAIGSIIPGIGTFIGAAIGAIIGAALAGVAAVFTGALAIGAGAAIDSFDSGGVAVGKGLLAKDVVEPERVLSPAQTKLFDRMVSALESGDRSTHRTTHVNAPIHVVGGGPNTGQAVQNHLLSLL